MSANFYGRELLNGGIKAVMLDLQALGKMANGFDEDQLLAIIHRRCPMLDVKTQARLAVIILAKLAKPYGHQE